MASRIRLFMFLAAFGLFGIIIIGSSSRGKKSGFQSCVNPSKESQLKTDAQNALTAIGSIRNLSASHERAKQGQHVFNHGLLGFHRSVLQDLLRDVGGYDEQLENLVQDLMIPLSQSQKHSISSMKVFFRPAELYVDYNADVFGEYVRELRQALVAYLKADTSVNERGRYGIKAIRKRVQLIAHQMHTLEVYVDPMARDCWLEQNNHEKYNLVRPALKGMFRTILKHFQKASDKIRFFRKKNQWSWKSLLIRNITETSHSDLK